MGLIKYIHDAVEKKHYEQLVARKLDCSVEDLQAKKINQPTEKRLKKVKVQAKTDSLRGIEDNLYAVILFGKATRFEGLELPDDETKLAELNLIFEQRYAGWDTEKLNEEAEGLFRRYQIEKNKQRAAQLSAEITEAEAVGDEARADELIKQLAALKIR